MKRPLSVSKRLSHDLVRDNLGFISVIWLFFLVFCNIYAYFYIKSTASLDYIFHGFVLPNGYLPELALILILLFYFVIVFLFYVGCRVRLPARLNLTKFNAKRKGFDALLVVLLVLYIYKIFSNGIGMAGGEQTTNLGYFDYLFVLIRMDYLAVLYVFLFRVNRASVLIISLVLLSSFMRGWVGDLLLLFLVFLGLSSFNLKKVFVSRFVVYAIILVVFSGFLLQLRSYYRLGGVENVLMNLGSVSIDYYFSLPHEIIMRFQQIYSLLYVLGNFDYFFALYGSGAVTPIYFEGIVPKTIFSMIVGMPGDGLGFLLADHNRDLIVGRKTAFTPGVLSHIILNPIAVVYLFFVPILSGMLVSFYGRNRGFSLVVYLYFLNLFSFGWASAYFSVAMASIVLATMVFISSGLVKSGFR